MHRVLLPTLVLGFALVGCTTLTPLSEAEGALVAAHGGRSELLDGMLDHPDNGQIDSLQIYKDGQLLVERHRGGPEVFHDLRSATKAITALVVGIAIDRGLVAEDQSILDFFPERRATHPQMAAIRVKDLLTMSSGLESDDWVPSSVGNEERMYATRSWVDFFFALPVVDPPGTRFRYSTAGVIVLGEIVRRASGTTFEAFAGEHLLRPLGITEFRYARTPAGETDSGGHLRLRSKDFAKIGLLMLQRGQWEGIQVVPAAWVDHVVTPAFLVPGAGTRGPYFGSLWWQQPVVNGEVRSFQARGNGGQFLIAVPAQGLLGVFTGTAYNSPRQLQPFVLMQTFVIPAFANVGAPGSTATDAATAEHVR